MIQGPYTDVRRLWIPAFVGDDKRCQRDVHARAAAVFGAPHSMRRRRRTSTSLARMKNSIIA